MDNKIYRFLSYILVSAISVSITLLCFVLLNKQSKLDQLNRLISKVYIGEYDRVKTEDMAASAIITSLGDRWSYYIPASEYSNYSDQMKNSYVGIGITISQEHDGSGLVVEDVKKNGPAAEAGMLPGDLIISIEGHNTESMTMTEARQWISGEENTTVSLTVLRMGEAQSLYITRKRINEVVAEGLQLSDTIGMVRINNFDTRSAEETIRSIEELLKNGAKMLIFDVRSNPGGYAHELVEILDYILPEGEIFRTVDYSGKERVEHSGANCVDVPMAVLINGESYSAAEFFAAVLSEYEVARTFGEQTCGKGFFQSTFRLCDGSAVGLSIGKYFTPKGISLVETGVTPDTVVRVDDETALKIHYRTIELEDDPQVQAAVSYLNDVWAKKNS